MLAVERLVMALLAVDVYLDGAVAEAPLPPGYNYPVPNTNTLNLAGNTIVSGTGGYDRVPGYVGAADQLQNTNYPVRYSNGYQEPDVHKHVYVHVAPEEPAEERAPLVVPAHKPKKHYKIVFIKTPTVLPPVASYVNLPQPDQEKTLIYVLSKKPDLQQSLVLSTPAPTQPAKPEVFFIRYKTNNEQRTQPQVLYNNGGQVFNTAVGIKPLSTSYVVPLGAPLGSLYRNTVVTASTPTPVSYT